MFSYLALGTKISSMSSHLFRKEDYFKLTETKNTSEYMSLLKTYSGYKSLLSSTSNNCARNEFEKIVYNKLFADYSKIFHYSGINIKFFLNQYLKKYEIGNIKTILKGKVYNYPQEKMSSGILDFKNSNKINLAQLMTASTIDDFISMLNHTEYYQVLTDANLVFRREKTFFPFDLALDNLYFIQLKKAKSMLPLTDQQKTGKLLGVYVDLINISWVVRGKFNYRLTNEQILAQIINIRGKIDGALLNELLASANLEVLDSIIRKSFYHSLLGPDNKLDWELYDVRKKMLLREYIQDLRGSGIFDIGQILSYLLLVEIEISELITIFECFHYGLPADEMKKYLSIN